MIERHPQLISLRLKHLRPTQITVGLEEVAHKRREWRSLGRKGRAASLADHWFPCVLGPEGQPYITDHHHFGLALLEEGIKKAAGLVLQDLSWLEPAVFWIVMDHHQWVHPYDRLGVRRSFDAVPQRLDELQDDPYRSLAGALRRGGGFAKDVSPYSEFLWADFFRPRIPRHRVRRDFEASVALADSMAHGPDARYLPGWSGIVPPGP